MCHIQRHNIPKSDQQVVGTSPSTVELCSFSFFSIRSKMRLLRTALNRSEPSLRKLWGRLMPDPPPLATTSFHSTPPFHRNIRTHPFLPSFSCHCNVLHQSQVHPNICFVSQKDLLKNEQQNPKFISSQQSLPLLRTPAVLFAGTLFFSFYFSGADNRLISIINFEF